MKHRVSSTTSALAHEIAALRQATPADLKERWRALYCTQPPRRISRDLLVRALAYRMQEQALGGLKPSTRRLLAKVAAAASAHRPMRVAPQPILKPGTVLLREWHGTQHQVIVREDGIVLPPSGERGRLSQIPPFWGPPNRQICALFPATLAGQSRAPAGLATCRESSNVCVIGAVRISAPKEDHTWALRPILSPRIMPASNHEAAGGCRP